MLHHPYDSKPGSGSSSKSTNSAGSSAARNRVKPLAINTLSRASTDNKSNNNTAEPTYGNYIQSPASASVSDSLSPASNAGNRASIPGENASLPRITGMHQSNFPGYARSHSLSTSYIGSWQQFHTHGLPLPPSDPGIKPDPMNTMIRPGMGYPELGGSISEASSYDRNSSLTSSTSQSDAQSVLAYHGMSASCHRFPYIDNEQGSRAMFKMNGSPRLAKRCLNRLADFLRLAFDHFLLCRPPICPQQWITKFRLLQRLSAMIPFINMLKRIHRRLVCQRHTCDQKPAIIPRMGSHHRTRPHRTL